MVKLDKIYTRGGDSGKTSLGDGSRIDKHAPRIIAQGDIDEANAAIGLVRLQAGPTALTAILERLQNDMFDLGADISRPGPDADDGNLRIRANQVARLEAEIDEVNADMEPLKSFVLRGGRPGRGISPFRLHDCPARRALGRRTFRGRTRQYPCAGLYQPIVRPLVRARPPGQRQRSRRHPVATGFDGRVIHSSQTLPTRQGIRHSRYCTHVPARDHRWSDPVLPVVVLLLQDHRIACHCVSRCRWRVGLVGSPPA